MEDATWLDVFNAFLNSAFAFLLMWAVLFALCIWLVSVINPFQEKWRKWEGSIITGIKLAEKEVPDDVPHAGLTKLDTALRIVLEDYADANRGKRPPDDVVHELKQAIQIKHAELDRYGGLQKGSSLL